jgi:hypothetical protein
MTALRVLVVALNLAGGVLMGLAVRTILGPDLSDPPRGPISDALWLSFHVGPCAALAGLAVASARIGSRVLPLTLVAVTLATVVPGVLVARYEAANPPGGFSPAYGIFTFVAVCAQYLAVLIAWAAVLGGWLWRRNQRPKPRPPGSFHRDAI